jgi:pantothenate synthetase
VWRALEAASVQDTVTAAKRAATQILDQAAAANPNFVLDYAEVVDPETFAVLDDEDSGPALLAAAATISGTRLIDNTELTLAVPAQVEQDEDKDGDRIGAGRGVRS